MKKSQNQKAQESIQIDGQSQQALQPLDSKKCQQDKFIQEQIHQPINTQNQANKKQFILTTDQEEALMAQISQEIKKELATLTENIKLQIKNLRNDISQKKGNDIQINTTNLGIIFQNKINNLERDLSSRIEIIKNSCSADITNLKISGKHCQTDIANLKIDSQTSKQNLENKIINLERDLSGQLEIIKNSCSADITNLKISGKHCQTDIANLKIDSQTSKQNLENKIINLERDLSGQLEIIKNSCSADITNLKISGKHCQTDIANLKIDSQTSKQNLENKIINLERDLSGQLEIIKNSCSADITNLKISGKHCQTDIANLKIDSQTSKQNLENKIINLERDLSGQLEIIKNSCSTDITNLKIDSQVNKQNLTINFENKISNLDRDLSSHITNLKDVTTKLKDDIQNLKNQSFAQTLLKFFFDQTRIICLLLFFLTYVVSTAYVSFFIRRQECNFQLRLLRQLKSSLLQIVVFMIAGVFLYSCFQFTFKQLRFQRAWEQMHIKTFVKLAMSIFIAYMVLIDFHFIRHRIDINQTCQYLFNLNKNIQYYINDQAKLQTKNYKQIKKLIKQTLNPKTSDEKIILLQGYPGSGKTTSVCKIIQQLNSDPGITKQNLIIYVNFRTVKITEIKKLQFLLPEQQRLYTLNRLNFGLNFLDAINFQVQTQQQANHMTLFQNTIWQLTVKKKLRLTFVFDEINQVIKQKKFLNLINYFQLLGKLNSNLKLILVTTEYLQAINIPLSLEVKEVKENKNQEIQQFIKVKYNISSDNSKLIANFANSFRQADHLKSCFVKSEEKILRCINRAIKKEKNLLESLIQVHQIQKKPICQRKFKALKTQIITILTEKNMIYGKSVWHSKIIAEAAELLCSPMK